MATEELIFDFSFVCIAFSTALEEPPDQLPATDSLDAYIPAADAWIEVPSVNIYEWNEEYKHRPLAGVHAHGGPL